jgi:hypothetical protein
MFTTWLMTMLSAVITIFSEYLVLISRMLAKMFSNRTYREWTIGIHLSELFTIRVGHNYRLPYRSVQNAFSETA